MINKILNRIETKRRVILVTGGIGEGKTLAMSKISSELSKGLKANLYSNYELKNSINVNDYKFSSYDDYNVFCIDEMESVSVYSFKQIEFLLYQSLHLDNIIFLSAIDIKRLNESIRKTVNLHLSVTKKCDEIEVNGVNVDFSRTIEKIEGVNLYNPFLPAQTEIYFKLKTG